MNNNGTLIAIFVLKTKILGTFEILKNNLEIDLNKVFVYDVSNNDKEYLLTFKASNNTIKEFFDHFTIIHVKNGCLFSINALNKLIENYKSDSNISNSDYMIEWEDMRGKLLLLSNGLLKKENIVKIEDKSEFFD